MAPKNTPSLSAWKSVAPVAVDAAEDTGDIFQPLKRLRDKYLAKAAELKEKAFGDNRQMILEASERYSRCAASVDRLITVSAEEVEAL
jgi:hypothetical protein